MIEVCLFVVIAQDLGYLCFQMNISHQQFTNILDQHGEDKL